MNKNIKILKLIILFINIIIISRLFSLSIVNYSKYSYLAKINNEKIIEANTTLRGRILDSHGNVLVDNKGIKVLMYTKLPGISESDELLVANKLANILSIDNITLSEKEIREFIYKKNKDEINSMVNKNTLKKYQERKISEYEFQNYKYTLITDEMINNINRLEVYIYNLMNKGYSYQDKIIKKNITDEELTLINELNLSGIRIELNYERIYNYDTSLNQIFGNIGKIPKEEVDEYLDKGYKLDSIVGISFLEKTYEEYLKGEKEKYRINEDNTLTLIEEGKKGNDLILTIDIEKQLKIDELLKEEIKNAKKVSSSKYYNGSYIVVSDPSNGNILAMSSYIYENDEFKYNTIGILKNSFTVGSVVKAASMSTLYKYDVIDDEKIQDGCVKLYSQKEKCSWKSLGLINDIDALTYSSNYYQFINAIKLSGYNYTYNMKFNPKVDDFNKYRDYFKTLGLGSSTKIDIEGESLGITGKTISGDLLLNLTIGQYDTYTPLMLNNYIATIANGKNRYKLKIANYISNEYSNKICINEDEVLNNYEISDENYLKIKEGLRKVVTNGTASSYIPSKYNGSGKTGTSETYYNGIKTYTKTFIAYYPSDNPLYAISIISPNIYYETTTNNYKYPINSKLSRGISYILFEN